jgi:hypothetical protein
MPFYKMLVHVLPFWILCFPFGCGANRKNQIEYTLQEIFRQAALVLEAHAPFGEHLHPDFQ